jgi:hypothetical protein
MNFNYMSRSNYLLTILVIMLAIAVPHDVQAAKKLKSAQINYILNDSEWDIERECGIQNKGPWKGVATFTSGGVFRAETQCHHNWGGFWANYDGKWFVEDNLLCINATYSNDTKSRGAGFDNDFCFEVNEDRFGYKMKTSDGNLHWGFRIRKHPEHSSYQDLSAAAQKHKTIAPIRVAQQPSVSSAAADSALWETIKYSSKISDFQRYLAEYPNGLFISLAENQIKDLIKQQSNPDAVSKEFAGFNFGTYHALVIGIDNYKNLPKLKTATHDARSIALMLQKNYGFKVNLLIDPARGDILDAFDDYLEALGQNDNLLIYYAGHGWLDETTDRGYWLPVDAKQGRRSRWLSNADITDTLKSLNAKHVMVVADSCYSGTLTRAAAVGLRDKDYLKRMSVKKARVAMVSGGLEPVADDGGTGNSPFAKAFLDALSNNTNIVDGTRLFSQIRRPVILNAQQTPEYSDVRNAGHDGGDFLFVRK